MIQYRRGALATEAPPVPPLFNDQDNWVDVDGLEHDKPPHGWSVEQLYIEHGLIPLPPSSPPPSY